MLWSLKFRKLHRGKEEKFVPFPQSDCDSINRSDPKMVIASSKGLASVWFIGFSLAPPVFYTLYDALSDLPKPFSKKQGFSFINRYRIRKAMLWDFDSELSISELSKVYDSECQNDIGPASPRATATLEAITELQLSLNPGTSVLRSIFFSLCRKPHVGEGVHEEQRRLSLAFKVAKQICEKTPSKDIAEKCLMMIQKCPPHLKSSLQTLAPYFEEQRDKIE